MLRGRIAAERLMVDACEVKRPNGKTFDEGTGRDVPAFVVLFSSKCKVQARELAARDAEAGGRTATTVRLTVALPMDAGEVATDDVVTVTAAAFDPQLVGRSFRVVAPVGKSFATARRVEVSEVVA